jgi:hypothetical protein
MATYVGNSLAETRRQVYLEQSPQGLTHYAYASHCTTCGRVLSCRLPNCEGFDRRGEHLSRISLLDTAVTRLFEMSQCAGIEI